ncbi:2,4-dihydroxyhept-2-ene-1,7-dioic acid aldolase [Pyricularia oryzae Y34]|uniref:2,4-dihydroxyhept-2-ene-1,7-dioic acid aldolase n=2 Tax=Pyricularia oryzae TaxID=318829 RepID=A0AA97PQ05_PYRO3|nr:2,4-dihydroxyhept-2-ene-1,7-dioic acid aldolase [Pyricularia oryzae Y34]
MSTMQQANRLKQAFMTKKPAFGLWQMLPGSNISRALARTPGIDWVMVDYAAMHEAVPAIAAVGVSPIVRIPDFQPWMVKLQEVKTLVSACKFPPEGTRGFGSPFAMHTFSPTPSMTTYLQSANSSLLTMVQIETREALERVAEIAPLVDVVLVGPFDLGNNIGQPILDGVMSQELKDAVESVRVAAERAGVVSGIFCTGPEMAKSCADAGWGMISVATDLTALMGTMEERVAVARGEARFVQAEFLQTFLLFWIRLWYFNR